MPGLTRLSFYVQGLRISIPDTLEADFVPGNRVYCFPDTLEADFVPGGPSLCFVAPVFVPLAKKAHGSKYRPQRLLRDI